MQAGSDSIIDADTTDEQPTNEERRLASFTCSYRVTGLEEKVRTENPFVFILKLDMADITCGPSLHVT